MALKYKYLQASDLTGNSVLAHIETTRTPGSTSLDVDSVDNWPSEFICTTGLIDSDGYIDPDSVTEFTGHTSGGNIVIDAFEPGFTDVGNTTAEVAIIKQTTGWTDRMAQFITPTGLMLPFAGSAAPTNWLLCDGASLLRADYPDLFTVIGTTFGSVDGTHFNVPDSRGRSMVGAGTGTFVETVAAAAVTTGTDQITVSAAAGLQLRNGNAVVLTTSGGAPAGLTAGNTYYVIAVDSTHIKLATTLALAVAGTAIDITTQGTGNHTLTLTFTARTLADRGGEEAHALTTAELPSHSHPQAVYNAGSGGGGAPISSNNTSPAGAQSTGLTGSSTNHNIMQPYLALNYIIKT